MRKFYTIGFVCMLAMFSFSSTQSYVVKGNVVTADGHPGVGVSVRIKGSKTGTTTNDKGTFVLKISKLPAVLIFEEPGSKKIKYAVTQMNVAEEIFIQLQDKVRIKR